MNVYVLCYEGSGPVEFCSVHKTLETAREAAEVFEDQDLDWAPSKYDKNKWEGRSLVGNITYAVFDEEVQE